MSAATRLEDYLAHPALENMRGSHVDWRSEGVEPPNALSRLNAVRVLDVANDLRIEPTYVAVSAEGGIGICFKKNGLYGDIECFNTGEMWAIFSDRANPAQTWQLDNTVPKISQALVTIDCKLNPDGATQKKGAPKGQKKAKGGKAKAAAPKKEAKASKKAAKPAQAKTTAPRAESKGAKILEMIGRAKGATLAEIMKATDWQPHSVRGFISTAAKKHSINIESSKNEGGDRVYRLTK